MCKWIKIKLNYNNYNLIIDGIKFLYYLIKYMKLHCAKLVLFCSLHDSDIISILFLLLKGNIKQNKTAVLSTQYIQYSTIKNMHQISLRNQVVILSISTSTRFNRKAYRQQLYIITLIIINKHKILNRRNQYLFIGIASLPIPDLYDISLVFIMNLLYFMD